MEASETQTTQTPEPTQGEATETQQTSEATEGGQPDVGSEGSAALEQRIAALEKGPESEGEEETPSRDGDLIDWLAGDEEEDEPAGEQHDDLEWDEPEQGLSFDTREDLDRYVEEKAAGVLQPYAQQQEMNRRRDELGKLGEQYPEIHEKVDEIRERLGPVADRYGLNPEFIFTDPKLVRDAFFAIKAEAAASAERPAEQAANDGASLETQAGPGSQGQSTDSDEEYGDRIVNAGGGHDFITR